MALCFALGSTCFLVGPFPGYAELVGDSANAITFFIGSILFTAGGGLQSWLAWSERHSPGGGRAAFKFMAVPNSDGNFGRVDAIRLSDRTTVWSHRQRAPSSSMSLRSG